MTPRGSLAPVSLTVVLAALVCDRLANMGEFVQAGELMLSVKTVKESLDMFMSGETWDRAQDIAKNIAPRCVWCSHALCLYHVLSTIPIFCSDYKSKRIQSMGWAWELARQNIGKAQKQQKTQHDKKAKDPKFSVGDRVFVYMPVSKACMFVKPFKGPYQIIALATYDNGADGSAIIGFHAGCNGSIDETLSRTAILTGGTDQEMN